MIDIGYLVGTSITVTMVIASVLLLLWFKKKFKVWHVEKWETRLARVLVISIGLVLPLAVWIGTTGPWYGLKYQTWDPVSGTVAEIEKRMVADGKAMSEKYVIVLEGNPQQYGCTDTRCALIKVGELVDLSCKRVWIYAGTDGFDCNYVSAGGRS